MGEGQDRRRSSANQEHGNRERALAATSEDSLLGAGGRRDPCGDPRLEEEAGRSEADRSRGTIAFARGERASRPSRRADSRRSLLRGTMMIETETKTEAPKAPAKGVQVTDKALAR